MNVLMVAADVTETGRLFHPKLQQQGKPDHRRWKDESAEWQVLVADCSHHHVSRVETGRKFAGEVWWCQTIIIIIALLLTTANHQLSYIHYWKFAIGRYIASTLNTFVFWIQN